MQVQVRNNDTYTPARAIMNNAMKAKRKPVSSMARSEMRECRRFTKVRGPIQRKKDGGVGGRQEKEGLW